MITAIIPAKSKSTRVPFKNIIEIGNKPLFQWTFDICNQMTIIDKVVVATDIDAIKKECQINEFEIFDLNRDDIEDRRTVRELWQSIACEHQGCHILLQPTSPFRTICELTQAFQLYHQEKCDVVVSVKSEHDVQVDKFGKSSVSNMKRLSQKHQPHYYISGSFWISNADYIKRCQSDLQEGEIRIFPVSPLSSVDINTQKDLEFAKTIAQGLNQ